MKGTLYGVGVGTWGSGINDTEGSPHDPRE